MLWLSSKDGLSTEEQQFGPWLRAPQFNLARKAIVEVQGVESPGTNRMLQRRTAEGTSLKNVGSLAASAGEAVANVEEEATKTASMEVASSGGVQGCDKHVHDSVTAGPHKKIPDFEAMIRDIDEAINTEPFFLIQKYTSRFHHKLGLERINVPGLRQIFQRMWACNHRF